MDSVLQALGFQDLEHAKDWICQNGQGQVIAVAPQLSSASSATPTERISGLQQQLKLLQLELEKKTKSIAHLRGFLADANVRIEQLEDQQREASLGFRRFGYDEQKTHGTSLMAELEYTRTDAETAKVELDLLKSEVLVLRAQLAEKEAPCPAISPGRLPDIQLHHANTDSEVPNYRPEECPTGALRSTATSYEALEVVNAHLRSEYHILSSTLAQERATFENERMKWRKFKRRFAARLLAQSTSNSAQQLTEGAESSRSALRNRAKSRPSQLGLNSLKFCPDSPHQDACVGEDLSSAKRKMASPLISQDLNRRHDHAQPSTARPAQCLSPPSKVLCDQARLAVPNQETASPLITHKKVDKLVSTSAAPHTIQLGMSFATRPRLSQQLQLTRLAENETVRLISVTLQSPSPGGPSSTLDEEENMPSPQPYQPPSTLEALLGIPERSFNEPPNRDHDYRRQPTSVSSPDSQRRNAQIESLAPVFVIDQHLLLSSVTTSSGMAS
ncbi:hypothetical protein CROQUDRAFT_517953 [Cronartium quercuum f. sp. fusiforme G11]|uniref:Uncharacterized protein n=1 Tax=Cronartium quercuum f. sp. fusiforme G11 TaxID=708437 RepID=A0A9P6TBQ0_9BASI|nr:hypothetical protein CROQUDRAFT_517953 [Cronartium quercuum f. sp. fusiforme G11]